MLHSHFIVRAIPAVAAVAFAAHSAQAGLLPSYTHVFNDAVTGNNQYIGNDGKHRWYVNAAADNYFQDFYERPTTQTFQNATVNALVPGFSGNHLQIGQSHYAASTYYEYIDIVRGRLGYDSQRLYLGIELFGDRFVNDSGTRTPAFGSGTHYNIRISNDPSGRGGLLLAAEDPAVLTSSWQLQKSTGYVDSNFSVGGPGGIEVWGESNNLNGYELKVINDGRAQTPGNPAVLETRRVTSDDGRPMVEFAFNVDAFNSLYADHSIDLNETIYVIFEATRGLKGNGNYLWNDKFNPFQAGTPYLDEFGQPGSIYEVDTLMVSINLIPAPGALAAFLLAAGLATPRRSR